jgi:hypothetical protein
MRLLRGLLASLVLFAAAEEAPEAQPDAAAAEADPVAAEPVEDVPLNCKSYELIDKIDSWSVDCVAMWLENLGFADLKSPFMGNKVDGPALKDFTREKLAEDYGVSDEEQRKKIYYNLKDVLRKDDYAGNTNYYSQMLMWILPFAAVYLWLSLKYEKQIARYMKRYRKWQEQRNPPKPVAPPTLNADGTSEWLTGLNTDLSGPKRPKEKKSPKEKAKKTEKAA